MVVVPREIEKRIGQSAGSLPKSLSLSRHGRLSTTERVWVEEEEKKRKKEKKRAHQKLFFLFCFVLFCFSSA